MSPRDNIVDFPDIKRAEEEAAEWLMRLDDGGESTEERAQFNRWLSASEQNIQAYRRIAELWGNLDQLEELNDHLAANKLGNRNLGHPERRHFVSMAASFIAVALVGFLGFQVLNSEQVYEGYFVTALGERRTVDLPDGSLIELNTASAVRVFINEAVRNIRLEEGEAYFDVAKDPSRPFSVLTESGTVKAVGTAFSVRLGLDGVNVTVREGTVQLLSANPPNVEAFDIVESKTETLAEVSAGQQAQFKEKIHKIEPVAADTLDRKLAWRNGMLAFAGEPLSEVVLEVSRYTGVSIDIEDDTLAATPVAGHFRIGQVDAMLDALQLMGGIDVVQVDAKLVRLTTAK